MGQPLDTDDDFTTETEAPEADAQVTEVESSENVSQAEAESADAAATEADKAAEAAAKEAEHEEAFNLFKLAAETAVIDEGVDSATGVVPAGVLSEVTLGYSKLGGTKHGKAAARNWVTSQMQARMLEGQTDPNAFAKARSWLDVLNSLSDKSAARERVAAAPVDPTEAFVDKVAALMISPNLALVPDGVAADWQNKVKERAGKLNEQVKTYRAWLDANHAKSDDEKDPAPEVDEVVLSAARIAQGRGAGRKPRAKAEGGSTGSGGAGGVRRDIGEHIRQAFADKPSGTWMTVSEIANFPSAEYAGTPDGPSAGAVSARLFPKSGTCTVEGIRAEIRDKKGAVKA